MDNFHVIVQSEGKSDFDIAMQLFFRRNRTAVAYEVNDEKGLIFYWAKHKDATNLPYEMELEATINFAWGWLDKVKYPSQPDHDGDNKSGFCVYNEDWGHVANKWQAFVAIKPIWAMYGK